MSKDTDHLHTLIKQKLINFRETGINILDGKIDIKLTLTDQNFRILKREAEQLQINEEELIRMIEHVKSNITFEDKMEVRHKIVLPDIPMGQHIRLITSDGQGEAIEGFIYIGEYSFIVVKHERGSLLLCDHLVSVTSPWTPGGYIEFEVYRNNERVIKPGNLSLYRTKPIKQIQFLNSQFDYHQLFVRE